MSDAIRPFVTHQWCDCAMTVTQLVGECFLKDLKVKRKDARARVKAFIQMKLDFFKSYLSLEKVRKLTMVLFLQTD